MTMYHLYMALIAGLLVVILMMLYRVFVGPSIYDRMNGLMIIGIDTILLLVLFGYVNERPDMYVDISIAYAILGFISFVVLAKFLSGKGDLDL